MCKIWEHEKTDGSTFCSKALKSREWLKNNNNKNSGHTTLSDSKFLLPALLSGLGQEETERSGKEESLALSASIMLSHLADAYSWLLWEIFRDFFFASPRSLLPIVSLPVADAFLFTSHPALKLQPWATVPSFYMATEYPNPVPLLATESSPQPILKKEFLLL